MTEDGLADGNPRADGVAELRLGPRTVCQIDC